MIFVYYEGVISQSKVSLSFSSNFAHVDTIKRAFYYFCKETTLFGSSARKR